MQVTEAEGLIGHLYTVVYKLQQENIQLKAILNEIQNNQSENVSPASEY